MVRRVSVSVLRDTCIGSGNCSSVAPEIFEHDGLGIAVVRPGCEITDGTEALREAVDFCPVTAIVLSPVETPEPE